MLVVCAHIFAMAHMFSTHLRHFFKLSSFDFVVVAAVAAVAVAFAPFSQFALNASVLLLDHVLFRFVFFLFSLSVTLALFFWIYYD